MVRFLSFLMILSFVLISCKKDSNDPAGCSTNWATEVQTEITNLSDAATAYIASPTSETCNAYKTAYQDYIDALEPFLECSAFTAEERAELQDAIDEAESDLSTLCDE